MKKVFIALAVGAIALIAFVVYSERSSEDRRVKTYVAALDKFSEVLEEEAAKNVEKRDNLRIDTARKQHLEEIKKSGMLDRSPEELAKLFNEEQRAVLAKASERLDKAIKALDPNFETEMKSLLEKKR